MKLEYFDLLNPEPIFINGVGSIISPKLKDIKIIQYGLYLNMLTLNPKDYFKMIHKEDYYETMNDEIRDNLHIFDLIVKGKNKEQIQIREYVLEALDFFIVENIIFLENEQVFLVYKEFVDEDEKIKQIPVGIIHRDNYLDLCSIICQRNYLDSSKLKKQEDISKVKSKKALEILKKIQKGREEQSENSKSYDKNIELGNIISKVSARHPSINFTNIYNLTVFQLYDTFYSLTNQLVYDLHSTAVAMNGNDAVPNFTLTDWFKKIDN